MFKNAEKFISRLGGLSPTSAILLVSLTAFAVIAFALYVLELAIEKS